MAAREGTRVSLDHYVLDADGNVVPEPDALRFAAWFGASMPQRLVARDETPGGTVSTVFLGVDHRFFGPGPPVLWETLVFGGPYDGEGDRYDSREAALAGHAEILRRVLGRPPGPATEEHPP